MRAAARRGDSVWCATLVDLSLDADGVAFFASRLLVREDDQQWMETAETAALRAGDFDVIAMRKEPPVDEEYAMATRLLDIAAEQTPVVNAPRALREWNEKTAIFRFPAHIPPTWTGADADAAADFHRQHGTSVLKPLNGFGGEGVYVAPPDDLNFRSVFSLLSGGGRRMIMAQAYLPAGRDGDSRVFVVGGAPLEWMLVRIPRADDHRGNLSAGGRGEARRLGDDERRIAAAVGGALVAAGIRFAGLDIIGGKLIEINITCPTGLREVRDQTGEDPAEAVLADMG